jgi:hypothetical protein
MRTMPCDFVRDGVSSLASPFANEWSGVSFAPSALRPKPFATLRTRWRRSSRSRWRPLLYARPHLPMEARRHGPPTRAIRLSANTTFQTPVLRRRSVLCNLDGLRAFARLAGRRSDQSGGQGLISQISRYRKQSTVWSLTMPVACMWVGIKNRGTHKRKSPPLEILAERA